MTNLVTYYFIGITVVVAAGNDGIETCDYSPPRVEEVIVVVSQALACTIRTPNLIRNTYPYYVPFIAEMKRENELQ